MCISGFEEVLFPACLTAHVAYWLPDPDVAVRLQICRLLILILPSNISRDFPMPSLFPVSESSNCVFRDSLHSHATLMRQYVGPHKYSYHSQG